MKTIAASIKRAALLLLAPLMLFTATAAIAEDQASCMLKDVSVSGDTVSVTYGNTEAGNILHVRVLADADADDADDSFAAYTSVIGEKTVTLAVTGETAQTDTVSFDGLPEYCLVETWTDGAGDDASEPMQWGGQTKGIRDAVEYRPTAEELPRYVELHTEGGTGYALLKEGGTVLNRNGGMTLTGKGQKYTISNADEDARALRNGQAVCFVGDDGTVTFLKISGIKVSGTDVTFTGNTCEDELGSILTAYHFELHKDYSGHVSKTLPLDFEADYAMRLDMDITLSGFLDLSGTTQTTYEIRNGEFQCEAVPYELSIPIKGIDIPLEIITLKSGLFFLLEAEAKLDIRFEATGGSGTTLNGRDMQPWSDGPHFSFEPLAIEGEAFIGLQLGQSVSVDTGVQLVDIEAGWDSKAGEHYEGVLHGGEGGHKNTQSESWHACGAFKCICGERYQQALLEAYIKFLKYSKKWTPWEKKGDPVEFHYSWTFGSPEKSDEKCPWYGTRLRVTVLDENDGPIKDVSVEYTPVHEKFEKTAKDTTDDKGLAILWPYYGNITVAATCTLENGETLVLTKELEILRGVMQDITLRFQTSPCTITFDKNTTADVSGMPDAMKFYPQSAEKTQLPSNRPERTGCLFLGWSRSAAADTPEFTPGSAVAFERNVTLYAVWQVVKPSAWYIVYDTDGGMPVPAATGAETGSSVTVTATLPSKEARMFDHWEVTAPSGTVIKLQPGQTVTENMFDGLLPYVMAHAVYYKLQMQITYYTNAGGTETQPFWTEKAAAESDFTLTTKQPSASGRIFMGWSRYQTAKTAEYQPGGTLHMGVKDVTLYGVWEVADYVYLHFDGNGGTGSPLVVTGYANEGITIPDTIPKRAQYTFLGWASSKTADLPEFTPGDTAVFGEAGSHTLYAVWQSDPVTVYRISYDANGGTGAPQAQYGIYGRSLRISKEKPKRTAHTFTGWTIQGGTPGTVLTPGSVVMFERDAVLVAVWEPDYRIIRGANGTWYRGEGGSYRLDCNGELDGFERLVIDGGTVDSADYRLSSGSTVVKLKEKWLKKLTDGRHTVFFVYDDGRSETEKFYVRSGGPVPETGDDNHPALYLALMVLSLGGAVVLIKRSRRS